MSAPRKFWVLLRIKISLAFFFPLAFGFAVAADAAARSGEVAVPLWKAPVGFASFFLASFFASTLNFYADAESDRNFTGRFKDMDLKQQPFARGEMTAGETVAAFAVSGAGCVALSLVVGLRFSAFITGFALVVGVLYSHRWFRLKARPVTDILCNVVGMGLSLMAGLELAGGQAPPWMFAVWGALFITVMYIPTVVNDVPFDEAAGYRTSGVVFGAARLLYSMVPLALAMVPFAVLLALDGSVAWPYRVVPPLGSFLTLAGTAVIVRLWRPPRIDLNPDVVLIPMDLVIAVMLVFGFIRLG